ncbi:putative uncharacterized protein DDB_G0292292 [Anabas testudineus]|uniref:putative uncharacterized protein DDB_G0292292 n=1 Tax=Anabas testudineus TaxID=64144 RepID=UPI000E462D55|nr:putative uncharacterized protein DDB_G0292292 [Anabas testudineus]
MEEDGRGDGTHNRDDHPQFPLHLFEIGEQPPAVPLNAGLLAWLQFLINHGLEEAGFAWLVEVVQQPVVGHNADNNINNEDHDNNENNENPDDNINNDNNENNENPDDNINNDNNDNHRDDVNNEDNDNQDNIDNLHNDDIHNDNIDDSADNVDGENANDTDASSGVENVEDDKLLLGRSRRRSREEDDEDNEDRSSKRFRWWDEFDDSSNGYMSDSDSVTDRTDSDNNSNDSNIENGSAKCTAAVQEEEEEDPLPGPSRKWSSNNDKVEEARRGEQSRQRLATGDDLAQSSSSFEPAETAGPAEQTNEEVNRLVEEEIPLPRSQRKRSRKSDDNEDSGRSKRSRH